MKLPKQWLHWCKLAGLKPERKHSPMYLYGLGRHWRVNIHEQFQMGEPYETFDRWANSVEGTYQGIPQTQSEFMQAMTTMIQGRLKP